MAMNESHTATIEQGPAMHSTPGAWIALLFTLAATPLHAQTGSLAPATINFGNQTITTTSAARDVTIANVHPSAPFQVIAMSSSNPARFPLVGGSCGPLPFTLAAGASCTVAIAFAPDAIATWSAGFSVSGTTPATVFTPSQVSLAGNGTPVPAVFDPGALVFPTTPMGTTSASQEITIGNADMHASLTISSYLVADPARFLVVAGGSCPPPPFDIAAGGMCSVSIAFAGVPPIGLAVGSFGATTTPASTFAPATVGLSGVVGVDSLFEDGFENPASP